MSVIYSTAAKTARMTAVRDACADGSLEVTTSAGEVLASVGLSASGGTVANGVWTLAFDGTATAVAAGNAALARIKNNAGVVVISGLTVALTPVPPATPTADLSLSALTLAVGQQITIDGFTLTHG